MKFSHSWRRYRKAILALFFCTSLTAAQAVDFMPVNDVTTGMEGIAKTVIVGDTISTFDVKVLGVMRDHLVILFWQNSPVLLWNKPVVLLTA